MHDLELSIAMTLRASGGTAVAYHRASVYLLLESVAYNAEGRAIAVGLTGTGRDGAEGVVVLAPACAGCTAFVGDEGRSA